MFWRIFGGKTVKELRKNRGLTARELAVMVKVSEHLIKKADHLQFRNVPEPLKSRLKPALQLLQHAENRHCGNQQ